MQPALLDELEEFIRRGALWDQAALEALLDRLEQESADQGDAVPALLAHSLRAVVLRMGLGEVPPRVARDIEGIVYPRLWKLMEAARDGLPDGELRTRVEVLNRRLSRRLVEEQA